MPVSSIIAESLIGILLLAFLFFARHDLMMLLRRPNKGMGTGLSRVYAVGRTTMIESWAGRVWMLPVLWLIASILMMLVVRPYDESDRFPLYIRILLTGQEWLILVMMWVMASVSLPRERERKIIVSNASKPLSRLEILLGKMFGFSAMAFFMLLVMGIASWMILHVADYGIRREAQKEYALAERDYRQNVGTKNAIAPPEDKKRLAEEGSLFAYNYVTVDPKSFSIVGGMDPATGDRYLKGGSSEKVIYHFAPYIMAPAEAIAAPTGSPARPYFKLQFPMESYFPKPPDRVEISVTAVRVGRPYSHLLPQDQRPQQKTIALDASGTGYYIPEHPEYLFSEQASPDPRVPPPADYDLGDVEVTVSCLTPGIYLKVKDGVPITDKSPFNENDWNVLAVPFASAPYQFEPNVRPLMRGFEKRDQYEIAGPDKREMRNYGVAPPEFAVYRFPGKSLRNIPIDADGNFTLSMALDVDKEGNYATDTQAIVKAYNQDTRSQPFVTPPFPVIEKRITQVKLPQRLLGDPNPAKRGDLVIELQCETQGHWIILGDQSVRIDQPPGSFLWNILKSEVIIFCEAALLIVICVTWSVRLGWPVAMLASFTCAVFGFIASFVAELPTTGGLLALGYNHYGAKSGTEKFFDALTEGVWQMLAFIKTLIPDYTRYDPLHYVSQFRNLPLSALGSDIGWTIIYALPFIALGYIFFRKQELG